MSGHIVPPVPMRICQECLPFLRKAGSLLPSRFRGVLPFSTCRTFKIGKTVLLLIILWASLSATKLFVVLVNGNHGAMKSILASKSVQICLTQLAVYEENRVDKVAIFIKST